MLLLFLGFMTLGVTAMFYIWKRIITGTTMAMMWIITGAHLYDIRDHNLDLYHLTGIFFLAVGALLAWEVFTDMRVERQSEREEELTESLEELEDEYADAVEQEDWPLARRIKQRIAKLKEHEREFSTDIHSDIRGKVQKKKWDSFDKKGTM